MRLNCCAFRVPTYRPLMRSPRRRQSVPGGVQVRGQQAVVRWWPSGDRGLTSHFAPSVPRLTWISATRADGPAGSRSSKPSPERAAPKERDSIASRPEAHLIEKARPVASPATPAPRHPAGQARIGQARVGQLEAGAGAATLLRHISEVRGDPPTADPGLPQRPAAGESSSIAVQRRQAKRWVRGRYRR